jgi:hypothetical protein
MNAPFQDPCENGLKLGSIGVHLSDNHTEYFELMSHITGAVVQTPLTLNKNTLRFMSIPTDFYKYKRKPHSPLHSQFRQISQRGADKSDR